MRWPSLLSSAATASPAGPEPITATVLSVRDSGGSGSIQPSSKPRVTIASSICSMVTASSLMSSTQADSQGAGQIRPVNSGKLFVACSLTSASRQRSRYTRSFQSGIRLPSGQPSWQNGMPQSMQRAPPGARGGGAGGPGGAGGGGGAAGPGSRPGAPPGGGEGGPPPPPPPLL